MPIYFFDYHDGVEFHSDEFGVNLPETVDAVNHAVVLANELMLEILEDAETKEYSVFVRSENDIKACVSCRHFQNNTTC